MWVSSSVVTLAADTEQVAATLKSLTALPVFEIGEAVGRQLPVVIEAQDGSTARYWHEWLADLPGVDHVDIAFVSFDESDEQEEESATCQ